MVKNLAACRGSRLIHLWVLRFLINSVIQFLVVIVILFLICDSCTTQDHGDVRLQSWSFTGQKKVAKPLRKVTKTHSYVRKCVKKEKCLKKYKNWLKLAQRCTVTHFELCRAHGTRPPFKAHSLMHVGGNSNRINFIHDFGVIKVVNTRVFATLATISVEVPANDDDEA